MGRNKTFTRLSDEDRAKVDSTLRRYLYGCIETCIAELAAAGIKFSRSALHRHAQLLKNADRAGTSPIHGDGNTLVTITDLSTNEAVAIRTDALPEDVAASLSALKSTAL
ncbi:MAG: hypothetical protein JSR83_10095 [Proteobacteria bacterium]|nr:hypothetical protein [Pseudomonadota bacterium]